jgi:putative transposase
VTKKYQTTVPDATALAVPGRVSIAIDEIAADTQEGLLALAVGAGLQVTAQLMEEDVRAVCGPKGRHDRDRTASRHGVEGWSVTLGGRRADHPASGPATDGSGEVAVPVDELVNGTELLGQMALERMLGGLSSRRYPTGLEPVGAAVEESSRSISRSAVSRRFVAMNETALADLLAMDLSELDLVALMIDGCTSPTTCASSLWA